MPQIQPPVNPTPNPKIYQSVTSNPDSSAVKTTVAADNSDAAANAVVSATTTAAGTLKRPREEDVADGAEALASTDVPEAKRLVKATHDVIYRIVVPSRQIGKVIGRAGHRIQKIREDSKATIKIADAISRHEERVIIISSKDSDNVFSDAENALHQIVSLILKVVWGTA